MSTIGEFNKKMELIIKLNSLVKLNSLDKEDVKYLNGAADVLIIKQQNQEIKDKRNTSN